MNRHGETEKKPLQLKKQRATKHQRIFSSIVVLLETVNANTLGYLDLTQCRLPILRVDRATRMPNLSSAYIVLADTQVFRSRDLSCSEAGLDASSPQPLDD